MGEHVLTGILEVVHFRSNSFFHVETSGGSINGPMVIVWQAVVSRNVSSAE